jgi:polysaccharide pyruvyl transferase WcaK-like protein
VSLIVAREQRCIDYLNNNDIRDNVCFMPDPAFAVTLKKESVEPEYIGINLSPLSLKELYGTITDSMLLNMASQIEEIVSINNLPVMLIPHVISPVDELDNDLAFMKRIYNLLGEKVKEKVMVCEPGGFLEAKSLLRKCHILIAARMHCAINAVSEGVPTLFLSYSEKAKGMSKFIYGDDRFLLSLQDMGATLPKRAGELLEQEQQVRRYLEERIAQIRTSMLQDTSLDRIVEVMKNA